MMMIIIIIIINTSTPGDTKHKRKTLKNTTDKNYQEMIDVILKLNSEVWLHQLAELEQKCQVGIVAYFKICFRICIYTEEKP
jgi:hypothetical protein